MDVINKEPSEEVWEKITQERRQRLWDELQIDATELDPPTNPPPGAIVLTELQRMPLCFCFVLAIAAKTENCYLRSPSDRKTSPKNHLDLISEAILLRQELTSVEDVYSYACKVRLCCGAF
jgi:hypothetical protein